VEYIAMNPVWWTGAAIFPFIPTIVPQIPLHIGESSLSNFANGGGYIINEDMTPDFCGGIGIVYHKGERLGIRGEIGPNEMGVNIFAITSEFGGNLERIIQYTKTV
jgi:hypothetical protein